MFNFIKSLIICFSILIFTSFKFYEKPKIILSKKDFLIRLLGYEEIINKVFLYEKSNPELIISLIQKESNFKIKAISKNKYGIGYSIGLMQLNKTIYTNIKLKELYNIDNNIKLGIKHYNDCLRMSNNNKTLALYYYNAGYGQIKKGNLPKNTIKYANEIIGFSDFLNLCYFSYRKECL